MEIKDTTERLDVARSVLPNSRFDDVNMSNTSLNNINLSILNVSRANMTNMRVEDANLSNAIFKNVNMSNVSIEDAQVAGMRINGITVADMLSAYHNARTGKKTP